MTTTRRQTRAQLPARAAAIRGDNLQHAVGLHTVLQALQDENAVSVSIEDSHGGAFDDVVIRREGGVPGTWMQVKSSNYGGEVIDDEWLTTARKAKGRSPAPGLPRHVAQARWRRRSLRPRAGHQPQLRPRLRAVPGTRQEVRSAQPTAAPRRIRPAPDHPREAAHLLRHPPRHRPRRSRRILPQRHLP